MRRPLDLIRVCLDTHTHTLTHTAVSRDERRNKTQDRAAKLPAKVWKERRAQWREREARHLRKAFEFWGGAAARQEEINRARGQDTMRKTETEKIITAEYKFFLTRSDCNGEQSPSWWARRHETNTTRTRERERGSIQTKGFQSQKSLTVKSRKCKLLFHFRNVAAEVAGFD